jgi:hypothetical protein
VRDLFGRFDAHDLLQRGIALQFPQAGFHVLVSEEDRQQHDAPEDAHWIIIASAASRRPQAFEQPTVGNAFQQPPDGDQCGMVFEALPRQSRSLPGPVGTRRLTRGEIHVFGNTARYPVGF